MNNACNNCGEFLMSRFILMLLLDASVSVSHITCNDLIILTYFKRIFTSAQLHIAQDALRVISRDSQGDDSAHSRLTCHSYELKLNESFKRLPMTIMTFVS